MSEFGKRVNLMKLHLAHIDKDKEMGLWDHLRNMESCVIWEPQIIKATTRLKKIVYRHVEPGTQK